MIQTINRCRVRLLALTVFATMGWGTPGKAQTTAMLLTDSIGKVVANDVAEATVSMAWPVSGPQPLLKGTRAFIIQTLADFSVANKFNSDGTEATLKAGAKYRGAAYDGRAVATFYADKNFDKLHKSYREQSEDGITLPPFSDDIYIEKQWEGAGGVSYTVTNYAYQGGAHGVTTTFGHTLSRTTGREVVEVIDRTQETADGLQTLLREGLTQYFKDAGEQMGGDTLTLADYLLLDDPTTLPLPVGEPWFTDEGLAFIYQQYEIASYAMGRPTFVVPYERIKPYLTAEARTLVP